LSTSMTSHHFCHFQFEVYVDGDWLTHCSIINDHTGDTHSISFLCNG